jgi:hypothetical protein
MPRKKDNKTEAIDDRVDMKILDKAVLDAEFRKGARLGFIIGAAVFVLSLVFGEQ